MAIVSRSGGWIFLNYLVGSRCVLLSALTYALSPTPLHHKPHTSHTTHFYRGKGCVLSVSSISGNHPGPFIQLYSATKAFITQFSRSMHVECWDSGVDFLVVTPSYVVSNLYVNVWIGVMCRGLYLCAVIIIYPIEWCTRNPWSSSIILYSNITITHNHHTNNNSYILHLSSSNHTLNHQSSIINHQSTDIKILILILIQIQTQNRYHSSSHA